MRVIDRDQMDVLPEDPFNQVSLPQVEFYGAGLYSETSQAPAREKCKSDFRLGIWHVVLYDNIYIDVRTSRAAFA